MATMLDGRWQLDVLNGAPEPESSQFTLIDGVLIDPETGALAGAYEVETDHLLLMISMPAMDGEGPWSLRVRLASSVALGGHHMLGEAEVVFSEGESFKYSECAFHRMQND